MARYRKIDPRIWNDEKFRELSDDGQLVFLFILTHPHMTSLGAMRATVAGLAAEKGWPVERFEKAFAEALRQGMLEGCAEASFVGVPRFLKYNPPESPNVVKAWVSQWDMIPECELKGELQQRVKAFVEGLSKGFREALAKGCGKAMPYQEQEQDRDPSGVSPDQERPAAGPLVGEEGPPAGSIDWDQACDAARTTRSRIFPGEMPSEAKPLLLKLAALSQGAIPSAWLSEFVDATAEKRPKRPAAYLRACIKTKAEKAGIDLDGLLETVEIPKRSTPPAEPAATRPPTSRSPADAPPEPLGKLVGSPDLAEAMRGQNRQLEPAEALA